MGILLGQIASTFFALLADIVILFTMGIVISFNYEKVRRCICFFIATGLCTVSAVSIFLIATCQPDLWKFFQVILIISGAFKAILALFLLIYSSSIIPTEPKSKKRKEVREETHKADPIPSIPTYEIPKTIQPEQNSQLIQAVIDNFADLGWNRWSSSIHSYSDQYKRILRGRDPQSLMYIIEYNSANGHAIVNGASGKNYLVSGNGCSCRDFHNRCLPCKHMYFLSFKIVQPNSQTTLGNSGYFRGLSFAIAGSSQEKIKKFITQRKGKVTDKVNIDTTALIVNTSKTTQKITDAQIHSVEMLTFDDLKELF